jgi:hypothetical protein
MTLKFEGNVAYKTDGNKIHLGIAKISNTRPATNTSGTLKIELITSDYKLENVTTLFGFQYHVVACFRLEPLEGGYSYTGISRYLDKLHTLDKAYEILTLEEYSDDKWVLRSYMTFD